MWVASCNMLSLVFGKDYKNVRKEAEKIVASFSSIGGVVVERHTAETISPKDLAYRAESNSLFGEKFAYIIDGLVDQYEDETLKVLEKLGQSQHLFVFCEDAVIKDIEKAFTSAKGGVLGLKAEEKERDNPFAITDALLSKDKKKTWQLYRKEIDKGESAEAVMGRLVWAIKTLVLIQKNPKDTATSLGISPFVYSKTKSAGKVWKEGEAEKFYTELLFGMKPGDEMEYHLERLILGW